MTNCEAILWEKNKCDKYDYFFSAFAGSFAGLIDIFFVGVPGNSKLGKLSDEKIDEAVRKFASFSGWEPRAGNEEKTASAIGFLEKKYKVNYDHRHTPDTNGVVKGMGANNHHFKSLSHAPDIIGLFFSILDQFTNSASFVSEGYLIRIDTSDSNFQLQGNNLIAKLFSGICNWFGHIMSDIAGSSGGRGSVNGGRGSGVSLPFMEVFQIATFGNFKVGNNKQNFAEVMTRVFQEGYDFRFGIAMATPVIIQDLMIRAFWVIRRRFSFKKPWKECIPNKKNQDLRIMLIISSATLCLFDGTDAVIKGGGNPVAIILRMNYFAWLRLLVLVFREIKIKYGVTSIAAFTRVILDSLENKQVNEFYERVNSSKKQLDLLVQEFIKQVDEEYKAIVHEIEEAFSKKSSSDKQAIHSVKLAQLYCVDDDKILKSNQELDAFFSIESKE